MSDIQYINGLIVKAPNERAPEYVKAKLSIKREALIAFLLHREDDWINAEIKVSKNGKWYVAVDAWKPNSEGPSDRQAQRQELRGNNPPRDALGRDQTPDFDDSNIPF